MSTLVKGLGPHVICCTAGCCAHCSTALLKLADWFGMGVTAAGELLAAWNVMRAFSWQLRLSPFSFADFCAAMASPLVGLQKLFYYRRCSWENLATMDVSPYSCKCSIGDLRWHPFHQSPVLHRS